MGAKEDVGMLGVCNMWIWLCRNLRRLKPVTKLGIRFLAHFLRGSKNDKTKPCAYVYISQKILTVFLQQMTLLLSGAGYRLIFISHKLSGWKTVFVNSSELCDFSDLLVLPPFFVKPDAKSIYVFDQDNLDMTASKWAATIRIVTDGGQTTKELNERDFYLPFPMRNVWLQYRREDSVRGCRNAIKKMRIFFSGNYAPAYDSSPLKLGAKMSRWKILQVIMRYNRLVFVKAKNDFDIMFLRKFINQFVLVDTSRFRIDPKDWSGVLSSCIFFLCPPGLVMPMCHNAIEAMAVGVIPIINYPDWFHPPLKHGETCLCFQTEDDLIDCLNSTFTMTEDQICLMRDNVIQYYENYLSPKHSMAKLKEVSPGDYRMHMYPFWV